MPIYEYECNNCGKRFEKLQSITADPLTECLICGSGPIRRVLQPVGVIFKGSGWYSTDSKKSSSKPTSGEAKADKGGDTPSTSSETKPSSSESKPDTKTSTSSE